MIQMTRRAFLRGAILSAALLWLQGWPGLKGRLGRQRASVGWSLRQGKGQGWVIGKPGKVGGGWAIGRAPQPPPVVYLPTVRHDPPDLRP